jgi:hypothetical protein
VAFVLVAGRAVVVVLFWGCLFALVLLEAGRAVAVVVVVLEVEELVEAGRVVVVVWGLFALALLEAGRVVVLVLEEVVLEAGRVLAGRAALCCAFW